MSNYRGQGNFSLIDFGCKGHKWHNRRICGGTSTWDQATCRRIHKM